MALAKSYKNSLGENVYLTNEVFEIMWGTDYSNPRVAKDILRMDFSGPGFALETLVGPEQGIMNDKVRNARNVVQVLNIGRNQLTDISAVDKRKSNGDPEFPKLTCLIASRNQLTKANLTLRNLLELNLAHNELTLMPVTRDLQNLQTLILAHNKINDTLKALQDNKKLKKLLLHDNLFSWKPSEFQKQMKILADCHLYRLTIFPNPFAKVFKEYQFLAVTVIDTLQELDGYSIDVDLRNELRNLEEQKRAANALDYSIFDIKVQERQALKGVGGDGPQAYVDIGRIPSMDDMIERLNKPLDHPNQLIKYCYAFKEQIGFLWGARYSDRKEKLTIKDERENKEKVNEVVSKMQLLLGRFDSAQDVLVECLVRLCASGNSYLSEQSAIVLADWVDSLPPSVSPEDVGGLLSIAAPLFRELRVRLLPGMQSFDDNPAECMSVQKRRMSPETQQRAANGFFGSNDEIAETAEILGALAKFGKASFAEQGSQSRCSILGPLLPVLCRASRASMGPDKLPDEKANYQGFGFFHGAHRTDCITVTSEGFDLVCYGRCVKHNYGGFEVRASTKNDGLLDAWFSKESPEALRGMRIPDEGAVLFTMPCRTILTKNVEDVVGVSETLCWDVWRNALDVLVVATSDHRNAQICVRKFKLHEILIRHEKEVFTEALLNVAAEAGVAFTSLLNLAVNLISCGPVTSGIVRKSFMSAKLHVACWARVRRRLTEGGSSVSRARLKQATPELTFLVSALVRIIFEMAESAAEKDVVRKRGSCVVMADLADGMEDLFTMMLEIAADTDVPDPLLLSASLQILHLFLACETTRVKEIKGQTVVAIVLERLHEIQTLLPYIRGPRLNDNNNNKYQDLWMLCEIKYTKDNYGMQRLPQLYDPTQRQNGEWREKCPELKELRNPLMHRVLLDIVKLLQLFSSQADHDPSYEFRRVTEMLDKVDREKILIGPSTGLVLVPAYEVKLGVLKVIQYVLEAAPSQFQTQEMGWLLRYLQSTGIGIGRQEEFLGQVLVLTKILIQNLQDTGFQFRQQFAKQAIRQAFEMLKANSNRDLNGAVDEEESKIALSLEIVNMIRVCSKPLSGGLRPFLRRVDFMDILKSVMVIEDGPRQTGIREPLLRTWTGRDMREVLLPLVTMNFLKVLGVGRYRSLVRLADVLQGRSDYERHDGDYRGGYIGRRTTDEANMWDGLNAMKALLHIDDELFMTDSVAQQSEFISQSAIDGCLQYVEKIFSTNESYQAINAETIGWIKLKFVLDAQKKVMDLYEEIDTRKKATTAAVEKRDISKQSNLAKFLEARLQSVNEHLGSMYTGISVAVFIERIGANSLTKLAESVKTYVEETVKANAPFKRFEKFKDLLAVPDMYVDMDGKLQTAAVLERNKIKYAKCRQVVTTAEQLMQHGRLAQRQLKKLLLSRTDPTPETVMWSEWAVDTDEIESERQYARSEGLVEFLSKWNATVYDPGLRPMAEIMRAMTYKYMGDFTRVRNRSRLIICFEKPDDLLECVREIKDNSRFSVLLIRNRFLHTSSLGDRYMRLYVEVQVMNQKFICELSMVLGSAANAGAAFDRESKLKMQLKTAINDYSNVPADSLDDVTDCIFYEMSSRAIRHQDMIYLESNAFRSEKSVMVVGQKVTLSGDKKTQRNLFIIERKAGFGPIKTGDVVIFQNMLTTNYLDSSPVNYGIRCRYNDPDSPQSNLEFVVEAAPPEDTELDEDGTVIPLTKQQRKKQAAPLPKILTHGTKFVLRVHGSSSPVRCLTALPPSGWGGEQILKAERQWSPANPANKAAQTFSIYREGSLRWFLDAETMAQAEKDSEGKLYSMVQTDEQEQAFHLQFAFMGPSLQMNAPQEGGLFRRSPPNFRDIALRKGNMAEDKEEEEGFEHRGTKPPSLAGRERQVEVDNLPTLAVAALCRCIYSLVELPALADARIFAIDDMLGVPEGDTLPGVNSKLSRLLSVAITATIVPGLGRVTPDGTLVGVTKESILVGWIAAKFLRTMSVVLFRMPALSLPAGKRKEKLSEPDGGLAKHQECERNGAYDKQRLCVLQTYSSYISRVLSTPILRRLAVASQRPLNKAEVTLLVEICRGVNAIVRAYYSNELRCLDPKSAVKDDEALALAGGHMKRDTIEHGTNADSRALADANPSTDQLALPGEEQHSISLFGAREERPLTCIRGKLESKMFSSLIPSNVLRVLVHAFLHGMRMETQAYAQQRNIANESDECVKLITALVQESIQALASCMYGCGDQNLESSCDYDVLEAISHAMCVGAQFVPRARVTQLMSEWHLEKHRKPIQEMIENEDFDAEPFERTFSESSEQIHCIAYVWVATFKASAPASELSRRLLIITSRQNFILLQLPTGQGVAMPDYDDIKVQHSRSLSRVQTVVVHPRMRSFVGLKWDSYKNCEYQALFFENYYRRREFVEVLRLVTRFRPAHAEPTHPDSQKLEIGPNKGINFTLARKDMILHLRKSCKVRGEARAEAQLVTISFIQSTSDYQTNPMEVLILTRDAVATIKVESLLRYWVRSDLALAKRNFEKINGRTAGTATDEEVEQSKLGVMGWETYQGLEGRSDVIPADLEDSDEENDAIPPKMSGDVNEMDDLVVDPCIREPSQLKKLTGVWFMAEPEPKVTLQFSDAMKVTFFSEGDRQRFRQHLACALKADNEGGEDDANAQKEQGKLWRVKPTAQTELSTVKKEVKDVETYVENHMQRLKQMAAKVTAE